MDIIKGLIDIISEFGSSAYSFFTYLLNVANEFYAEGLIIVFVLIVLIVWKSIRRLL